MPRLDIERQKRLEPIRMQKARTALENMGLKITFFNINEIQFFLNKEIIRFYPYSGWHCGKGIKDGRGFQKLIKQIKRKIK